MAQFAVGWQPGPRDPNDPIDSAAGAASEANQPPSSGACGVAHQRNQVAKRGNRRNVSTSFGEPWVTDSPWSHVMHPDFGRGAFFEPRPPPDPPGRGGAASFVGRARRPSRTPAVRHAFPAGWDEARPCQPPFGDPRRDQGPGVEAEFAQDVLHVTLGGTHGDDQARRDLRVGQPVGDQVCHLQLPPGQWGRLPRRSGWIQVGLLLQREPDRVDAKVGASANSSRKRCLPRAARLLETVGPGRCEGEGASGLGHADDVPDALGGTQQQRRPLTRTLRGCDASRESSPTATPIRSPIALQDDGLPDAQVRHLDLPRLVLVDREGVDHPDGVALPQALQLGDDLAVKIGMERSPTQ